MSAESSGADRITTTYCNEEKCAVLYTIAVLMLLLRAVGVHNRAGLIIVKPEFIPKSSPEGNEWMRRQSFLADHQQRS